jgi:hypothetical protein
MVGEDMNHIPKKIVVPCPQRMDNGSQLKIMRRIVLFMAPELSRRIGNHTAFLHENTIQPSMRSITVHIKGLCDVRLCQHK